MVLETCGSQIHPVSGNHITLRLKVDLGFAKQW